MPVVFILKGDHVTGAWRITEGYQESFEKSPESCGRQACPSPSLDVEPHRDTPGNQTNNLLWFDSAFTTE